MGEKWNRTKDKVSDWGKRAGARITQGVDITMAELSLRHAETQLNNAYANLGRLMYPFESGLKPRDDAEVAAQIEEIKALREQLAQKTGVREEALNRQIGKRKAEKTATDENGEKVPVEVVSPAKHELKFCPKCLMGFDEALDACPYCGYKPE